MTRTTRVGEHFLLGFRGLTLPAWLIDQLGVDLFARVEHVVFEGRTIAGPELRHLAAVPDTRFLDFRDCRITENSLAELPDNVPIERLAFVDCLIAEDALAAVRFLARWCHG